MEWEGGIQIHIKKKPPLVFLLIQCKIVFFAKSGGRPSGKLARVVPSCGAALDMLGSESACNGKAGELLEPGSACAEEGTKGPFSVPPITSTTQGSQETGAGKAFTLDLN